MKVTDYGFGRITVDGQDYTSDIKIIKGRIHPNWWRKQGHLLQLSDITDILEARPDVLVVGTGAAGVMRIDQEVKKALDEMGIRLEAARSKEAVSIFNELLEELGPERVSFAIHLTC